MQRSIRIKGLREKAERKDIMSNRKSSKRFVSILLAGIMCVIMLAGCAGEDAQKNTEIKEELLTGKHHVEINIKDKGTISVELDADVAPITVTNFVNLAQKGFYDGLTFHRIIEGFMMQGGDPKGDGTGGSDEKIKGEFSSNGVENSISHTRGTISMARSKEMNSASSQFFIMHQDSVGLDGDYAAFGHVTEGMEIVDDICENTTGQDYNGLVPVENRPVIEKIVVLDSE